MAENHVKNIRAFIAIPLPGSVRHLLTDIQSRLKRAGIKASWPQPDRFHLTLKFLGETPCDRLEQIHAVMHRFSGQYPDLFLAAGSLGVFPKIQKVRVIWADIKGDIPRLEQLCQELDKDMQKVGIPGQTHPFSPHITLARIKAPVSYHALEHLLQKNADRWSAPFSADSMVLYESILSARGAEHTRMFQTKLGV
jgi:2'-5' RNA ligase